MGQNQSERCSNLDICPEKWTIPKLSCGHSFEAYLIEINSGEGGCAYIYTKDQG